MPDRARLSLRWLARVPLLNRRWACVVLLVTGCERSVPNASAPVPPRTVVVNGTSITLGEPLVLAAADDAAGDSIVVLHPEPRGARERVVVRIGLDRRVISITTDFAHGVSYDSLRAAYTRTAGRPRTSQIRRRGEKPADVATWRDERTEMELVRDPNRSAWTVRIVLRSR